MPVIGLPTLNMYYEEVGPSDRPPVILLHGATETFSVSWRRQVGALSDRWRVIGADLRGHGKSDNPAGALDLRRMADDIRDLMDALGLDRVHVCGFSGGGSTALFMASRHPHRLRSVTLISNNFERDEARRSSRFWDPERIAERDPMWIQAMEEWHAVPPAELLAWWEAEDQLRPAFEPHQLEAIDLPTLVVAGDRDPVVPLSQSLKLYRSLPNAALLVIPGVGHGAPHRGARVLNPALDAFWRDVERDRRRTAAGSPGVER